MSATARPPVVAGCPDLDRTLVMGVVNVTPDSISDGGAWFTPEAALAHGRDLVARGADLLDVGGESTRPGAERPITAEELRRVVPVVRELARAGATVSVDTMRASGAGGQHVNTTDSAVRITHLPTGIIVTSSEKSQHQNRANAMAVLRARLYEMERARAEAERSADRRSQVGSGDRSERIRTYNFPQGRVTDHRINLTLYSLDRVMQGDLGEIIDALVAHDQAAKLAEAEG